MEGAAVVRAQDGEADDDATVGVLGDVFGLARCEGDGLRGRGQGYGGLGVGGCRELAAGRNALRLAVHW